MSSLSSSCPHFQLSGKRCFYLQVRSGFFPLLALWISSGGDILRAAWGALAVVYRKKR
jgi:hypothetical protein